MMLGTAKYLCIDLHFNMIVVGKFTTNLSIKFCINAIYMQIALISSSIASHIPLYKVTESDGIDNVCVGGLLPDKYTQQPEGCKHLITTTCVTCSLGSSRYTRVVQ